MQVLEIERDLLFQTYRRLRIYVKYGEGVYLVDFDGRRYLDMIAGIGVNALGYSNCQYSMLELQLFKLFFSEN